MQAAVEGPELGSGPAGVAGGVGDTSLAGADGGV
jgi:hypothetical protein